jgi:intracellular multiplication protein IcmL
MAESENTEDPTQGKKTEDINTSEPEMMTVTMKSNFYKDSYSRILFVLLLSITLNFGLASTVLYFIANPPQAKYFATSINGRITPLSPLDMPNQSDSAVIQWATQAAIAAYTYNFVNYQNELKTASKFFTRTGWGQFLDALKDSKSLEIVKKKKLIVSAVAAKAPVILQKGLLNGRYQWRIQVPVLVSYQSASENMKQRHVVSLLVKRISTLETARGIGISQFIVRRSAFAQ